MKKLFLYYPTIFPVNGGQSVHGYNLVKELNMKNYQIVTYGQKKSDLYHPILHKKYFELIKEIRSSDIIYYRTGFKISKFEKLLFLLRRKKQKLIMEVNAPIEEMYSNKPGYIITKKMIRIFNRKLHYPDYIVVVSKTLKKYLIDNYNIKNDKIIVAPNGANPDNYKNPQKTFLSQINDKIKIFWAGNPKINFQSFDKLIEITKEFKDQNNILFIFGGIDTINTNLINVIFLPKISYKEIFNYINNSNILLAFYGDYKWSEYGFYNSSLKFFDYMASGKPVIAPNMGQIKDIATHLENAFLYNDKQDIIDGINKLVNDKKMRDNIGRKGAELVLNNYTWEDSVKEILDNIE